jgi:hypothetical protein
MSGADGKHGGQDSAVAEEYAGQIRPQDRLPVTQRGPGNRAWKARSWSGANAGRGHEHVDPAESAQSPAGELGHVRLRSDVEDQPEAARLLCDLRNPLLIPAYDDDMSTGRREGEGAGAPYPAAAPGDDRNFVSNTRTTAGCLPRRRHGLLAHAST